MAVCVSCMLSCGYATVCLIHLAGAPGYCWCAQSLNRVQLFVTPGTVAHQAPLSMGFPRQEYWSGLPFPPPEDLLDPGIEPTSPALASVFFTTEPSGNPCTREHMSSHMQICMHI